MPEWTRDQLAVIKAENREILVSAAAGSGKTAVLVERVTELIRKGYKLNRMLIITYTHAAAAEMKEKIRVKLESERSDPLIAAALDSVESSIISTIHSFCKKLIHSQFQAIGKDPKLRMCEDAQQKQLLKKAFRRALDQLSRENDIFYEEYRKAYDLEEAEEAVFHLYNFLMSLPDPFKWLRNSYTENSMPAGPDHPWVRYRWELIRDELDQAEISLNIMKGMLASPLAPEKVLLSFEKDTEVLKSIREAVNDPEITPERFAGLKLPEIPKTPTVSEEQKKWKKVYSDTRGEIRNIIEKIGTYLFPDYEKMNQEFSVIGNHVRGLARLTEVTAEEYARLKDENHLMDFSDLEQGALKILENDDVCKSVREEYDFIFVDESQDVSAIQDAIIRRIHGEENHLFTVGDVKQSIYRFRHAEPTLFLDRVLTYDDAEDADKRRIFLQANFRSRPEILETTNAVFRKVMKKNVTELDYEKQDELVPGRKTDGEDPVLIDLIENDRNVTGITDLEAIADHIVSRGTELLNERYEKENRNYSWRDMVILMPVVKGVGQKLEEFLTRKGVPVFFDGGKEYYEQEEIRHFRNLMNVIDHPWQDIALIATLRATPFFFTDNELADIRIGQKGREVSFHEAFEKKCGEYDDLGRKCAETRRVLDEWRFLSEVLPLGDFLWRLLRESGYYYLEGAYPDGPVRQANLRILCNQATKAAQNGIVTLHDFLVYMTDMSSGSDVKSAKLLGGNDDLVRIMTMHKSKGLQFPIVFCVGIDAVRESRQGGQLKCHSRLGVCLHYRNPELAIWRDSYADELFDYQTKKENAAERLRLLYVAMTRAQEKLFLLSCCTGDYVWEMPESDARIMAADKPVDWIMQALAGPENGTLSTVYSQPSTYWKIRHFDANSQKTVEKEEVIHSIESWFKTAVSGGHVEQLWNRPETGPAPAEFGKTSVTTLIRGKQELEPADDDPDEDMEEKRRPADPAETIRMSDIPEYPAFMQESEKMTAAHRGTVVHHFLSLADLDLIRKTDDLTAAIRQEKQRMTEMKIFSPEESGKIREEDIAAFFRSEIGRRMLNSPDIRREWNFNLLVPEMNNLILQGIIDCAFAGEDGWILLDYKTDRNAEEEELKSRYADQLKWYARAVSTLTGKPVREMWLYALSAGKAYRI